MNLSESYLPEYTTVWSFPERGNWATHNSKYRGNFAPQIARNIIEMYSQKGDSIGMGKMKGIAPWYPKE